ncbi:helix-turn-helix domain-containing protein [Streptomyces sp. NPDC053048]|uniref:helix-turn-helix domain-containing protein n=1 Tax=Streptomyces sp. NPDC053048 TaxID=3365694 RepID=UPI0037D5CCEE
MPRWRALPEELDPQVREFAEQLRRLVERSGLSIAAVADRTGYSKTSWERYLNGRLLPPRGAAEALAEATGTDVGHLGTLWELAERAWSRSELRHDVTMEAIRVAEARAALGEFGPSPEAEGQRAAGRIRTALRSESAAARETGDGRQGGEPRPGPASAGPTDGPEATPLPGLSRPPGESPDVREKAIPLAPPRDSGRTRRNAVLFTVGAVGALFVVASGVLLLGAGDEGKVAHGAVATPSVNSPAAQVPEGVKCSGGDCAGKDPETMGCGGSHATTAGSATVGTSYLEVRYSKVCGAAWARITQAAPGDILRISTTGGQSRTESGTVDRGADGHTRMIAVTDPGQASACAALMSGRKGCTVPRPAASARPGPTG